MGELKGSGKEGTRSRSGNEFAEGLVSGSEAASRDLSTSVERVLLELMKPGGSR